MKSVKIRYEKKTFERKLPEKWNELTNEQILHYCKFSKLDYHLEKFNIVMLQKILNIHWVYLFKLDAPVIVEVSQILEFLHKPCKLTRNPYPEITIDNETLLGPEDGLTDCVFEEFFLNTETCFKNYIETKDEKHLNLLIASLYRVQDKQEKFKLKEKFNPHSVDSRLAFVEKIKPEIKEVVLLFYIGCKNFISMEFKELFENNTDDKTIDNLAYLKFIDCLNSDNIANNGIIKQTNIYEVLTKLKNLHDRNIEMEKINKTT